MVEIATGAIEYEPVYHAGVMIVTTEQHVVFVRSFVIAIDGQDAELLPRIPVGEIAVVAAEDRDPGPIDHPCRPVISTVVDALSDSDDVAAGGCRERPPGIMKRVLSRAIPDGDIARGGRCDKPVGRRRGGWQGDKRAQQRGRAKCRPDSSGHG